MDELKRFQDMQDELLNTYNQVVSNGVKVSDEWQGLIADQLQWITSKISELSPKVSPIQSTGSTPVQSEDSSGDKLRMSTTMPSSNVHSFGYDPENEKLYVKFQGDFPSQNGPVYSYDAVPPDVFDLFQSGAVPAKTSGHNAWGEWWEGKSPSLGASLSALIKGGGYNYTKLT